MAEDIGVIVAGMICSKMLGRSEDYIYPEKKVELVNQMFNIYYSGCPAACYLKKDNGKSETPAILTEMLSSIEFKGFIEKLYGLRPFEFYKTPEAYCAKDKSVKNHIFQDFCIQLFSPDFRIEPYRRPSDDEGTFLINSTGRPGHSCLVSFRFRGFSDAGNSLVSNPCIMDSEELRSRGRDKESYLVLGHGNMPFNPWEIYIIPDNLIQVAAGNSLGDRGLLYLSDLMHSVDANNVLHFQADPHAEFPYSSSLEKFSASSFFK